jgi:tetratricopeptide (TPR) repeat protein
MVAVDAAGVEVARLVGYPGPEATLGWLAGLSSRPSLDAQIAAATGSTAAKLARELAEAGDDRARTVLGRVTEDDEDTRVTRLLLDGRAEDAAWLFDHGTHGGDWVYAALDADPKLAGRVPALVPGAEGEAAAGWLAAAADQLGPGREADALHAGALAALEAARSGELELDRGRLTDLAELRAELGNLASAYAVLDEAAARWPDEFTWPFAKARIALDGKDLPTAEAAARKALDNGAGDQILRAAMSLARVLVAEGRAPEAIVTLNAALLAVAAPPADMQVRTTRYRTEVQKMIGELGG